MILGKTMLHLVTVSMTLSFFQACSSSKLPSNQGGFYYSNIYFGKYFSSRYQQGIIDGCKTSKGYYTKIHTLFRNNVDYSNGWFLGRSRCKHLLKINKNGDLIS